MILSNRPYRLIISGGGTGGHIFPAIAIAMHFQKKYPTAKILFIGAKGKMEMTKVPEAGFEIIGLWIAGINRKKMFANLIFPIKFLFSLLRAKGILYRFKPDIIVGTGGYASAPITLASFSHKTPLLIQEQNSYAGLANRWIAKKARVVCVAYSGMERYFPKNKITLTGNPVQEALLTLHDKKQTGLDYFSLDPTHPILLVIGGSLGAATINQSILAGIQKLANAQVQVIWQTGTAYYPDIKKKINNDAHENIKIFAFIKRMDLAYTVSHVIISRAGALAISELCIAGKAAILVPSPNVAENHQLKNAQRLTHKKAALLIQDHEAQNRLVDEALKLLKNKKKTGLLSDNIKQLAKPNATHDIVREIEKII